MNIKVAYQPTAKELAKASSLFAEKKPFLLFVVGFINIALGFFLIVFVLTFILNKGLSLQQTLAFLICALWLFARRPFNEWLLFQRMKHNPILSKPLTIEISRNGIIWSGKGLKPGNMTWDQITYLLEAKNGFILPNTFTRFLWLPFRGFSSTNDIQEFKNFIKERQMVHRVFSKWEC